ncbi:hypothetical protein EYC84_010531 [Monilinia fructicola]|uniref:Uncharacterized protein n=1 Tax=Monilinia fructicola TaxID=38448 RepID=A0A5M9JA50_MONFR|nr:hypothetical protein EYC84_010531 [Monilinia fructicola]
MLVSPSRNDVRDQPYEVMIDHYELAAYSEKNISAPNRRKRVDFGEEHENDTINEFWSYIIHTDEAYMDPASQRVGKILREQGTRYEPENIVEYPALDGNKIHWSAWVLYYLKAKMLLFYYDEEEHTEGPVCPSYPRRRSTRAKVTKSGLNGLWNGRH